MTDRAGAQVRLLAAPFYRDPNGNAAGAVVSAASLSGIEAAHQELVVTIVVACAGLLALSAIAGFLLAGRSLRPAARSLAQQEALLADAAHELRTPIASIRATLEAAQLEPAATAAAVEEARATSVRMGDTVDALLAWARLEAGAEPTEPTELRLDQLVEDVGRGARPGRPDRAGDRAGGRRRRPDADPDRGPQPARQRPPPRGRAGRRGAVLVTVAAGAVAVSDRGPGLDAGGLAGEPAARFRSGAPAGPASASRSRPGSPSCTAAS